MQLGNLYVSMMVTDNSNNVELDKLLTIYYNGTYDVTEIMKTVSMQIKSIPCLKYGSTLKFYTFLLDFSYIHILIHMLIYI